jgi:hypothetical protein
MRRQIGTLFSTAAAVAAIWALGAQAPSAAVLAPSADPCSLISPSLLGRYLGFKKVEEESRIGDSYPVDPYGEVASRCDLVAWSGGTPTNPKQILGKAAKGTAARFYIRTWVPDPSAPAEGLERWAREDFPRTVEALEGDGVAEIVRGLHGGGLSQPSLRAQFAKAYQGAKGPVRGAAAFWWDSRTHTIIFLGVLAYAHSPAVKQLEKIARTAVPAFGL